MNFKYPISKADNTDYQATDLYSILSQETSGHYLLGNHRFWHGGIHFSSETVQQCVLEQPVRCVADGTVIAYQITKKYSESTFGQTKLDYSTCFCLVKHEYKSPSEPITPPAKDLTKLNDEWKGKKIRILAPTFPAYSDEALEKDRKLMPKDLMLEILQVSTTTKTINKIEYYPIKAKVLQAVEAAGAKNNEASDAFTKDSEIWFAGFDNNGSIRQSEDYKVALFEEEGKLNNQWQSKKIRILAPTFLSCSDANLENDKKTMPCGLMLEVLQVSDTKITLSKMVYHVIKCKVLQAVTATSNAYAKDEEIWFAGLKTDGSIRQSLAKVDLFKEMVAQDWTDKTITLAKGYTGYKAIADSGNQASEKILVPEKTALQIKEVQTEVINDYHYSKVTASTVLKIQGADKKTTELPANTEFWIALTDTDGYVPLTEDNKELYSDTTPPPEPKTNKLTFYSLYMHLLPYEEYPTKEGEINRKAKITVDNLMAYDKIIDDKNTKPLGTIPKDTQVIIEETKEDEASNYNYAKVKIVDNEVTLTNTVITEEKNAQGAVVKKTETQEEVVPPKEGFWIVFKAKQGTPATWTANAEELPLPKREYPSYWAKKVTAEVRSTLNARQAPAAGSNVAGAPYGVKLSQGDKVTYDNTKVKQLTIDGTAYDMAECQLVTAKKAFTDKQITTFWASVTSNAMDIIAADPIPFDKTDKNNPVAIRAGDPVGYLGLYEVATSPTDGKNSTEKKQVHIEIFTVEAEADLQKFLDNEAGLTIGRQFIKISKGAILERKSPYKDDQVNTKLNEEWKNKQIELLASGFGSYTSDQASATGKKVMPKALKLTVLQVKTVTQKINDKDYYLAQAKVLEDVSADATAGTGAYKKEEELWFAAFTADEKMTYSNSSKTDLFKDTTPVSEEAQPKEQISESTKVLKNNYYQVQYEHIIAPEETTLKENYYKVTIDENNKHITGYISKNKVTSISQYALSELGFKIVKEESDDSGAVTSQIADGFIDQAHMTPFFQEICNEIAPQENGSNDKKVLSLPELRSALKNPRLSNKWSKLIAYHPTEWKVAGDDNKWKRLEDQDMLPGDANKDLREHEKNRITSLIFWDNVPDLANQTAAYHFHPVAFIDSLYSSLWHDPIDNPQLCLYSQGGGDKPWHGSFGQKIRDGANKHTGIDIFAKIGTPVYACVKSEVVTVAISTSMFGGTICLKVLDDDTFKSKRNHSFKPKYPNKTEIAEGPGFSHDGELYCFYAHLSEFKVKTGDIVNAGDIIALSGTSGERGVTFKTRNPHLHFEVRSTPDALYLKNKCNPCIYVACKDEDTLSEEERRIQTEEAKEDRFQSHQTKL